MHTHLFCTQDIGGNEALEKEESLTQLSPQDDTDAEHATPFLATPAPKKTLGHVIPPPVHRATPTSVALRRTGLTEEQLHETSRQLTTAKRNQAASATSNRSRQIQTDLRALTEAACSPISLPSEGIDSSLIAMITMQQQTAAQELSYRRDQDAKRFQEDRERREQDRIDREEARADRAREEARRDKDSDERSQRLMMMMAFL